MGTQLWTELEVEVIDRLLHGSQRPLRDADAPGGPGIYAFFWAATPLRWLDHPGMRNGRWPCYIGVSDTSLAGRLTEHRLGLLPVRNLSVSDFTVITLELPSRAAARFAEAAALAAFRPLYAEVLKGFGSKPQGGKRRDQARSPFSVMHPGRPGPTGPPKFTAAQLRILVRHHLAATVPPGGAWNRPAS